MNNIQKRFLLFIFGCIVARLSLVFLAIKLSNNLKPYLGVFCIVISAGLMSAFISGRSSGIETFGEKIWWNSLRPIHTSLFLFAGILLLNKNNSAYKLLLADTLFGLSSFLIYHYTSGNFRYLILDY